MISIEERIEQMASVLVMLDAEDLPALAALHTHFEELEKQIADSPETLGELCRGCAKIITTLILGECGKDSGKAIKLLETGISSLQAFYRDHRELSCLELPAELCQATKPAPPKAKAAVEKKASKSKPQVTSQAVSTPSSESTAPTHQPLIMNFAGADTSLVGEFLNEAEDHCRTAEQKMLDLESGVDNEANINAIFRSFHTIKGAAGFLDLHPVSKLAHESETLLDLARKGSIQINGRAADLVFASIDGLRQLLKAAEAGLKSGTQVDGSAIVTGLVEELRALIANPGAAAEPTSPRVGDILVDMGATTQQQIDQALAHKVSSSELIGETLVKQGVVEAKAVAHALKDQQMAQREAASAKAAVKEIVKIDTERLDKLVDTIGELVIAESMVGHDEEFLGQLPPRIAKNVAHLNKITRELQDMGMSMRLVPVKGTFQKLARAVRDLTRKSGKKVELIMSGEDSEVDRSIVETIGDPLMHMIRNAVDHAIEAPDERVAAGKPETGHIWLRAFHRGGNIQIEIEDDGRGLDTDRILAKARERGLIDPTREYAERDIFNLVLLPGFSTAKQITDISGRGVGMDVVKKNIDAMRGHLEIESRRLLGTKFTMKLPLTLAMIDGMLISVGDERYIIPTLSVVESINLAGGQVHTIRGEREMINLRGTMLPLLRLHRLFQIPSADSHKNQVVVVVEDGESQVGIIADQLIGQRQTVIKSLGKLFARQKWISGGAILSDGTVGLIIDISGLIELASTVTDTPVHESNSESTASAYEDAPLEMAEV